MVITEQQPGPVRGNLLIEVIRDVDEFALGAVREFVETVNGILPDVRDDPVRRKIIDSAVKMTGDLIGASTELAEKIIAAARDAWAPPIGESQLS